MSDIKQKFGNRLRHLRKKKNLTQEDLSNDIDVDRTYIVKIENGNLNPTLEVINQIASQLDTKLWRLFHFDE